MSRLCESHCGSRTNSAGAHNAACLAARMIALHDSKVAAAVQVYRQELAKGGS